MSTPAKHRAFTPGPWSIDDYGAGQRIVVKGRQGFNGDFRIADAHFSSELSNCVRVAEMQANARLIAAAPTMFEAGSALVREFDNIYDVDDGQANIPGDLMALVDKLRAALALATPVLERDGK